jgi:hypothetical protein
MNKTIKLFLGGLGGLGGKSPMFFLADNGV